MLDSLQVPFVRVDHDALPTIEACREVDQLLGTDFYLLLMPGNKKFKTAVLSKQIGSARLSFGEAEFMESFLNITPGSVSVMGLMNDREKRVRLLIDKDILEGEYFACHPCINTSSLREKESICKRIYIQKNLYIKVSIYKRFHRIGEILTSPSTPRSVPFGTTRFNSLLGLSDSGQSYRDNQVCPL